MQNGGIVDSWLVAAYILEHITNISANGLGETATLVLHQPTPLYKREFEHFILMTYVPLHIEYLELHGASPEILILRVPIFV
jgi:hypothetical protein